MLRQVVAGIARNKRMGIFFMSNSVETQEPEKKKSYRMPVEKQIQFFKPQSTIRMHNCQCLLFLNQQRLSTPSFLQSVYTVPFLTLIYLIRYNPWYLTFPASLPIMMGLQIGLFFGWIFHKRHYKYIIERVYLLSENYVLFTFSNKIRRKLKDTEQYHIFLSPQELQTPPHGENGQAMWSQKGKPFPETLKYKMNKETKQIDFQIPTPPLWYGWTKYIDNYTPYIFPKSYQYANWQILVPLLSGRYIDLSNAVNETHEMEAGEELTSIEQELKWIKEDMAKNQEEKRLRQHGAQKIQQN